MAEIILSSPKFVYCDGCGEEVESFIAYHGRGHEIIICLDCIQEGAELWNNETAINTSVRPLDGKKSKLEIYCVVPNGEWSRVGECFTVGLRNTAGEFFQFNCFGEGILLQSPKGKINLQAIGASTFKINNKR